MGMKNNTYQYFYLPIFLGLIFIVSLIPFSQRRFANMIFAKNPILDFTLLDKLKTYTPFKNLLNMSSVLYCKCHVQRLSCPVFVMSKVCCVQCLLCLLFIVSRICHVSICYVQCLFCLVFVMSCVCYVQGLLCLGFVVSGLLCLRSVISRVCYVQLLLCLWFVCLGFVIINNMNDMTNVKNPQTPNTDHLHLRRA